MAEDEKESALEEQTETELETATQTLRDYMARTKKQQKEVAKELGISTSAMSAFLSGTYATPHTILPKIKKLISISEQKQELPTEPPFKMTSISQSVTNVIRYCHLQGKIGVAYGDAGVGKTMAALEYVQKNPEAILITAAPCFATITGMNELLAEELKIKEKISRHIFKESVRKLKGSNRVIIVDEAQHLTVRVINHLRTITDASGVGIAFVGNEEIYIKMRGAGKAAYAQLFSRIGDNEQVLAVQFKKADIELVFEEAALAPDALAVLFQISRTNYGLRGAVNVFSNTITWFQIRDYEEVTAARIARMAKEMNIS